MFLSSWSEYNNYTSPGNSKLEMEQKLFELAEYFPEIGLQGLSS